MDYPAGRPKPGPDSGNPNPAWQSAPTHTLFALEKKGGNRLAKIHLA